MNTVAPALKTRVIVVPEYGSISFVLGRPFVKRLLSVRCLSCPLCLSVCPVCDVGVLWPNG